MCPQPSLPVPTLCAALLLLHAPVLSRAHGLRPDPTRTRPGAAVPAPTEPWRIASAVRTPAWLDLRATHRTRYERLQNQYRMGVPGNDTALSLRTTLFAQLRLQPVHIGAEVADSRLYLADDNAPLDTSLVNPLEVLQAYAALQARDLFVDGATGRLRAGRVTMNVGSRRLVARNRFRNTINTFTGLDLLWSTPSEDTIRVFATTPVQRRPTERKQLRNNALELDREMTRTLFWGVFYGSRPGPADLRAELYLFGLRERDSPSSPTRNRKLLTPGLRLLRTPRRAHIDIEVEAIVQGGSSRSSTSPEDRTALEHLAFFAHGSVGYTLEHAWTPRLGVQYDYASGDANPNDNRNGRFDTLFGARRFELGPTGIYGALARSNLSTPGLRVEVCPRRWLQMHVAYRAAWLAQRRDAWTPRGAWRPSGSPGRFIGHQLEARIRWRALPENTMVEAGFARLRGGDLPAPTPQGTQDGDPFHAYVQLVLEG